MPHDETTKPDVRAILEWQVAERSAVPLPLYDRRCATPCDNLLYGRKEQEA